VRPMSKCIYYAVNIDAEGAMWFLFSLDWSPHRHVFSGRSALCTNAVRPRVERKCIMHAYVTVSDTAGIRGRLRYTSSRYAARNHVSLYESHELYLWRLDDESRYILRWFDKDLENRTGMTRKMLFTARLSIIFLKTTLHVSLTFFFVKVDL